MITERILDLCGAYRRYGYAVLSTPIEGQEELYADNLRKGLDRIDQVIEDNRKAFGYRGLSVNAIKALHRHLPEPIWGVELA